MTNTKGTTFHILHSSVKLNFGGQQTMVAQILRHLDGQRFQTFMCCVREFGYVDESIQALGRPMLSLGVHNRYDLPRAVWRINRVIEGYGIDLLLTGIFGSEFTGLLAAISAGIPVVGILESTYDLDARAQAETGINFAWRWKWRTLDAMHGLLARMPKVQYIAFSQAIKQSAVQHLHVPPERIIINRIGLVPEEFDGDLLHGKAVVKVRTELGLDEAYPVLLNVARLSPIKGQEDLLKAMPRVLERFPRARLLIAGDGHTLSQLAELRDRLGLRGQVLLLGRRHDIAALLHASDVFVFSSYYEGLPRAVIEAMASGKCTVAFDIPALREVIRDGYSGVLVEGRNVGRFAESIIELAENYDAARNMGERARQTVQREFDIRQNVKGLEALFERMLMR